MIRSKWPNPAHSNPGRYDIDALRIFAFSLLILFHVSMFYVLDWGWHVKSAYQSQWLQLQLQLQLPLLFGMAVVVAPQCYYEALSKGLIEPGFLNFMGQYLTFQDFPGEARN